MKETENIFEGAKFGDKFITRDNHIAIYGRVFYDEDDKCQKHILLTNDYENPDDDNDYIMAFDDGHIFHNITEEACKPYGWNREELENYRMDIVGRYVESIDEEKLDELAKQCTPKIMIEEGDGDEFQWGFAVGYRKAKEE